MSYLLRGEEVRAFLLRNDFENRERQENEPFSDALFVPPDRLYLPCSFIYVPKLRLIRKSAPSLVEVQGLTCKIDLVEGSDILLNFSSSYHIKGRSRSRLFEAYRKDLFTHPDSIEEFLSHEGLDLNSFYSS